MFETADKRYLPRKDPRTASNEMYDWTGEHGGTAAPHRNTITKSLHGFDRKRYRLPLLSLTDLSTPPDFENFEEKEAEQEKDYAEALDEIADHLQKVLVYDLKIDKDIKEATPSEIELVLSITAPLPEPILGSREIYYDNEFRRFIRTELPTTLYSKLCNAMERFRLDDFRYMERVYLSRQLLGLY
jgi:hypothetical protein